MSVQNVRVFQKGTSQRHTARCECGWQSSVGSLEAAKGLADDHRRAGCVLDKPDRPVQLVPTSSVVATTHPPPADRSGEWSPEQLEILKRDLGIKNDDHLAYFAQVCQHKNLDPFMGEVVPVYYGGELVIQETVEGLRTIAERSGLYDGFIGPEWCGPDMVWRPVWLEETPPAAARYSVRRKDWSEPACGVARWKSSVQLDRNGRPMPLWRDRPDEMLGKTAEVRALKRAFPKEFARAGVPVRDLSDAQVVAVEARRAGFDDDERHRLVSEVTGGRTESTRELTAEEMLEVRGEVARRADVETGEIEQPDAVARTIARGTEALERRMERLDAAALTHIKAFRRARELTRPLTDLSRQERTLIDAELDRYETEREIDPGMEEDPGSDGDDAGPVEDAELVDEFGDEPF